jgi:hypothetical protein
LLGAIAMRRALAIAFACGFLMGAASPRVSAAKDFADAPPREQEDARAGMCDDFDGPAFTFCVALCEARDCDLLDAGDTRCTLLRRGFADVSGGVAPPCDDASSSVRAL